MRAYRQISLRQLTSEVAFSKHSLQQEELVQLTAEIALSLQHTACGSLQK